MFAGEEREGASAGCCAGKPWLGPAPSCVVHCNSPPLPSLAVAPACCRLGTETTTLPLAAAYLPAVGESAGESVVTSGWSAASGPATTSPNTAMAACTMASTALPGPRLYRAAPVLMQLSLGRRLSWATCCPGHPCRRVAAGRSFEAVKGCAQLKDFQTFWDCAWGRGTLQLDDFQTFWGGTQGRGTLQLERTTFKHSANPRACHRIGKALPSLHRAQPCFIHFGSPHWCNSARFYYLSCLDHPCH